MAAMEVWIIFMAYTVWAVYSGHKWIQGRYEWLERKETANKVCKVFASVVVGYIIGAGIIVIGAVKLGMRITEGFR